MYESRGIELGQADREPRLGCPKGCRGIDRIEQEMEVCGPLAGALSLGYGLPT